MQDNTTTILKAALDETHLRRLLAVGNPRLNDFVAMTVELCEPAHVWVGTDSDEDAEYTRRMALELGEEKALELAGHTVHFDGIRDQGRDREMTKYLVPEGRTLSKALNQTSRESGLAEIRRLLKGSMKDRTLIVRLMTLGPQDSEFSVLCVECTDSFYVSHSLDLLYRRGYEAFRKAVPESPFIATLHSAGKLTDRMVSAEEDKKRIYIDYGAETVYSVNTQYAGNTVGLKKLALRLTIRKADREGWLAEHMFLMGVKGSGDRKTYFAGAFPSACGKTSTAMLPGETIVGDDIAFFRAVEGQCKAVNAESGIFGIMKSVNAKDDPVIWNALHKPGEIIFSNILEKDGKPYWLEMGEDTPDSGENFSGKWSKGQKDASGAEIPPAHKNARYAMTLRSLANCDSELDNPDGVNLAGIMYGGRDAKAYVPCQQSFDWTHGIVAYGAALETETTFATTGKEGVAEINLMSIQDFVAVALGKYVRNNLDFGKKLDTPPLVFGVNYFLRGEDGEFLNGVQDKHVWIKWMELRAHGEAQAIAAPTGLIPCYDDLKRLFKDVLDKDYTEQDYVSQFTIRVPENLDKLDRVEAFHRDEVENAPEAVFRVFAEQRQRLLDAQKKHGDYISPFDLA